MARDVTDALAKLTPTAVQCDRDDLMFRAGRASVRPSRLWPAAAAVLLASNVALLCWPAPTPVPMAATAPDVIPPIAEWPAAEPDPRSYIALTRGGWDIPPAAGGSASGPPGKPLTALSRDFD
jgi:hypothetical protein